MGREISDSELRHVELGILDYIDTVCKENNIRYFLDYGTLLGAVRHKGFIPWDDDIDICMLRDDYVKFCDVFNKQNSSNYLLLTSDNDREFPYEIGKVVDTRTKLIETDIQTSKDMGVWVDIFPKDFIPKRHKFLRLCLFISFIFRIFAVYKKFPPQRNKVFYPLWVVARLLGYRVFLCINKFLISIGGKDKTSPYVGNLRDFVSKVYYWDRTFFEDVDYVEFEGRTYPAPKNWDEYLKGLYGNYMVLPPEDKRKRHKFDVYWR